MRNQYEQTEVHLLNRQLREICDLPLQDRKNAREEAYGRMATAPESVAEAVAHLVDGNYGMGGRVVAIECVINRRLNRAAALVQIALALDIQCPPPFVRAAWKRLTVAQKENLNHRVNLVIQSAEKELENSAAVSANN